MDPHPAGMVGDPREGQEESARRIPGKKSVVDLDVEATQVGPEHQRPVAEPKAARRSTSLGRNPDQKRPGIVLHLSGGCPGMRPEQRERQLRMRVFPGHHVSAHRTGIDIDPRSHRKRRVAATGRSTTGANACILAVGLSEHDDPSGEVPRNPGAALALR